MVDDKPIKKKHKFFYNILDMGQLCNHNFPFNQGQWLDTVRTLDSRVHNFFKDDEINLDTQWHAFYCIYIRGINQHHVWYEIFMFRGCISIRYPLILFLWPIINPLSPKYWRIYDQVKASPWLLYRYLIAFLKKEAETLASGYFTNI